MIKNNAHSHWLVFIGLCHVISLQVLMAVIYVFHFIPIHLTDPVTHQIVQPPAGLELEREMFFYVIYLSLVVLAFLVGLIRFNQTIESPKWFKPAKYLLIVESVWLSLLCFAVFKLLIYRYPFYNFMPVDNSEWVSPFFIGVALLSFISKLFWPEIYKFINAQEGLISRPITPLIKGVGISLAIALTAWMLISPQTPINQWMIVSLLYLVAFGYLCFCLTQSIALSLAGAWLLLKLNLFNYSLIPSPWVNPSITLAHQLWEPLFFLLCCWLIKTRRWLIVEIIIKAFVIIYLTWLVNYLIHHQGLPIYFSLRVRQFSSYFIGLMVPVVYMVILLSVLLRALTVKKLEDKHAILMLITGYGLMAHALYIHAPTIGGYGRVMMPWVLLIVIGSFSIINNLALNWRRWAAWGMMLIVLLSLMTNRLFVIYHQNP